jgi:PAS domain S-box-containing protein
MAEHADERSSVEPGKLLERHQELERLLQERSAELAAAQTHLRQERAQRQQLEAQLGTSEAHYRTLFEESYDAIFMTAPDGTLLEVNQALLDLFGYTRDEAAGLTARDFYANPDDRAVFIRAVERTGTMRNYDLQFRKKDGTVLDCLISARLKRSPDGQILGYQGIIHDITERMHAERAREDRLAQEVAARTQEIQAQNAQLEDALRQVRDMQDQLITQQKLASLGALTAGIAHEIRNPLNFINNFADLSVELAQELRVLLTNAQDHFDTETFDDLEDMLVTIEQNMQKITEHGRRADRIVNGMLQHSRGQPGVRAPTELNVMLEEAVGLAYHGLRAQDSSFNVTIHTTFDPAVGKIDVVPQDISRVFLNILNNAFYAVNAKQKAAPEDYVPTVTVTTADLGHAVEIRIRDNGDGMAPEVCERIFQPFFTTKPAGSGSGLGLSISHDIVVQEHQGDIRVETEVGQYTALIITFPKQTG